MITRIIKATLLAAVLSFCLVNASTVHAKGGNGGGNSQGNSGSNSQGQNNGNGHGGNNGIAAPELNPNALAGGVAFLAAVLLLQRHRRKETDAEPELL